MPMMAPASMPRTCAPVRRFALPHSYVDVLVSTYQLRPPSGLHNGHPAAILVDRFCRAPSACFQVEGGWFRCPVT